MKLDKIAVIAIIACAVVVIGEYVVYSSDYFEYSADAEFDGSNITYSVSSSGSNQYSVITLDNGDFAPSTSIYIYSDDTYSEYIDIAKKSGVEGHDQDYCIDQLIRNLKIRCITDVTVCNNEKLTSVISDDLASPTDKILIVFSYALPSTIYTGTSGDPILQWIDNGGRLYWIGSEIGKYYSTDTELRTVDNNQELFFGVECINNEGSGEAYEAIDTNNLTYGLSLKNNSTKFGLDINLLSNAYAAGFTDGTYSSISFVKHGNGMICVMAGDYRYYQSDDCSQVIAAGLSYCTKIIEIDSGSITRTTHTDIVIVPDWSDNAYIYAYIGGYYTVYGEAIYAI